MRPNDKIINVYKRCVLQYGEQNFQMGVSPKNYKKLINAVENKPCLNSYMNVFTIYEIDSIPDNEYFIVDQPKKIFNGKVERL